MSTDDLAYRRWLKQAIAQSGDKLERSGCMLAVFTSSYKDDPDAVLQFGIAMLLDKPIYLVVPDGTQVPVNVIRAARGVEFYKAGDSQSMKDAVIRLNLQTSKPTNE